MTLRLQFVTSIRERFKILYEIIMFWVFFIFFEILSCRICNFLFITTGRKGEENLQATKYTARLESSGIIVSAVNVSCLYRGFCFTNKFIKTRVVRLIEIFRCLFHSNQSWTETRQGNLSSWVTINTFTKLSAFNVN